MEQSHVGVYPIYKYVKEITDADIDNLDDSHDGFKEVFKLNIRKLNLNDKINIVNSKMHDGLFTYEKNNNPKIVKINEVLHIERYILPKSFLNTNFEKVFDDYTTSNVKPGSLGGKRKRKRKTTRLKSKNKRNMSKRRK